MNQREFDYLAIGRHPKLATEPDFNIGRTPPELVDDAEEGVRFMRGLGYGFLFATMFWAPIVAAIVGAVR